MTELGRPSGQFPTAELQKRNEAATVDVFFDVPSTLSRMRDLMIDFERGDELETELRAGYQHFIDIFRNREDFVRNMGLTQKRLSNQPITIPFENGVGFVLANADEPKKLQFNEASIEQEYRLTLAGDKQGVNIEEILITSSVQKRGVRERVEARIIYENEQPIHASYTDNNNQFEVDFETENEEVRLSGSIHPEPFVNV